MTKRKPSPKPVKRATDPRKQHSRRAPHEPLHLIIGIGASAGGLAAFKTFLTHMPADTGMAFVLVQHLSPEHKSMLVELLQPQTSMPIQEAKDRTAVSQNSVYIIPPNATLTIKAGVLRVEKPAPERLHRRPIDTFFCALAEDQGERAVAIVLSGVGSDGSLGVRTIKENGGLTIAQAEFEHEALSGMPHSAAATGLVDHVELIEAMPGKLIEYQRHLNEVAVRKDGDGTREDAKEKLGAIAALLRTRTGHDFRGYKQTTLTRRVQRRMQVLQMESVPSYIERLKAEPGELDLLFRELLIGVTEFFRNPEAFDGLTGVIGNIIADKGADDVVRIWVPGCSTGEEVYSIAIMLRETTDQQAAPKVVIFGTDIDANAIAVARAGRYHKVPPGLSQERFERWFVKDGDHHCPIKEIRDLCVFSVHSLIKDPPFSKLDLISCRNLLIYLNSDVQHRVMQTFHYALKPDGYLFLGPSESATRDADLFALVDKKHRILQRRDVAPRLPTAAATDVVSAALVPAAMRQPLAEDAIEKRARRALEPFSPAYFVIDGRNEVIHFSGAETGHYIEPSSGAASFNLFAILRKDVRQAVRTTLQKARAEQRSVVRKNLSVRVDGQSRLATLIIEPISEKREAGLWIVAFRDSDLSNSLAAERPEPASPLNSSALEQELRETKVQLQDAVNDLEFHIEETKSATEEYQSVNEELQAANEELETAKEEMQSINEELQTVNAELHSKNDVLMGLNSDLQNLMDSTEIAIVFLDQDLRIKNYTPAIAKIFPLREGDRGRPLSHIVSQLIDADLDADVTQVRRTLATVEREVQVKQGDAVLTLLMRVRPYRTVDNRIDGVVVTFVDINAITLATAELARFAALARASGDGIIGLSLDGVISTWSPGAEHLLGYTSAEVLGRNIATLGPRGNEDEQLGILQHIRRGEEIAPFDSVRMHKDGHLVPVAIRAAPILSPQKVPIGISATLRDISVRKKSEEHEMLLKRELSHRVKNSLSIIQSIAHLTLRSTPEPEVFSRAFQGRLQALASAHDILTTANWSGVEFGALAHQQLAPFLSEDTSRLELKGPTIVVQPETATSLGLILHELATNASKYGALSVPTGSVSLAWRVNKTGDHPSLHITWRESGGPPVKPPTRRGFGSQLMERSGVTVDQNYAPTGLVCNLEIALFAGLQTKAG
jgi:two-component system CheB/CheR fusion protein